MIQDEYILSKFNALLPEDKVQVLLKALDLMAEGKFKNKVDCISLAMGIPLFPQIKSIINIEGYKMTVRFDNQEERIIDFLEILEDKKPFHELLLGDYKKFKEVEIIDGTLAWLNIGSWSKDINGNEVFDYYDIDPGLLYENSAPSAGAAVGGGEV
ncbi:MAG: DUF2442 domain-containing protein [Phaeodactylibacter sp.]|nr:DUF2442 domain-containing protein [Phaeodactylibacter sp.]MCB9296487.1 DUF2442 domain-containing protein [Lewinellaceae bacterium]